MPYRLADLQRIELVAISQRVREPIATRAVRVGSASNLRTLRLSIASCFPRKLTRRTLRTTRQPNLRDGRSRDARCGYAISRSVDDDRIKLELLIELFWL